MSNNDCSQCLALNTSYRCQWCNNNINNNNNNNNGGMCYGDCSNHGGTSNTCPPPVVTKVRIIKIKMKKTKKNIILMK